MNVYCVDDKEYHLERSVELVTKTLQDLGVGNYKIFECQNGAELIDQSKKVPPDLVMLDINMPVLDGLSTLVQFRSFYPNFGTKIIMVSSENQLMVKRLAKVSDLTVAEQEKKKELLDKVIDRVKSGTQSPGKINSVLEACASLALDPIEVAKECGANGYIKKPYELEPTSQKLAKLI